MAFNGSGTFTLATSAVVTGTTISSTWANTTLNDIAANGLTVCLTKDGQTTPTADIPFGGYAATNVRVRAIDGLVGTPGISFKDDTDCGLYRIGTNNIGIAVAGAKVLDLGTGGLNVTGYILTGVASPAASEIFNVTGSVANKIGRFVNSSATTPGGLQVYYSGAAPNDTGKFFAEFEDTGGARFQFRSNGGLANYQANNADLSDERRKTDINPAGSYLSKVCAIPVKTFRYIDQTDEALNLGVIAQDVEAVAPELVDSTSGFGETPEDGIPLKTIYTTDMMYALMKALQELKAEFDAYKLAHP